MAERTGISWCDATWNPWWGCTKVSPACDHCYAERDSKRFSPGRVLWGVGSERRTFGEAHWQQPFKWAKRAFVECTVCGWRGMHTKLRHVNGEHECPACSSKDWHNARIRVFCASMGDVFDKDAPDGQRARLFRLIADTPELDWLLLTKRIGNAHQMIGEALIQAATAQGLGPTDLLPSWPLQNVWLGATVVNQEEYDRDIGKLLRTPARVHFLSIEPMLGAIDMRMGGASVPDYSDHRPLAPLSWVIAGGESGPHARPAHPDWFRSLRDQCAAAGVAFHFKQWGEWTPGENVERVRGTVDTAFLDDDHWSIYPLNLATDHGHIDDQPDLYRVGKKAAGRLLDGHTHNGFPEAAP